MNEAICCSVSPKAHRDDIDCILVVDDDPIDREVIIAILEDEERCICSVESGKQALEFLQLKKNVSLVLLDVQMPNLNGFETARRIRNRLQLRDLPILFLTATHSDDEFIKQGFGVGAQDYLTKPFNAELLNNKVNLFMRLYRQQQALLKELKRRRKTEMELRLNSAVFEHSPEAVLITDAQNRVLNVNRAFLETTGYEREEIIGQTPRMMRSGRHGQEFYQRLWKQLNQTGRWSGEIWNRRKDGSIYPEWLNLVAVADELGEVRNYVAIYTDFSGHDRLQDRLHKLTFYDNLTGLPNRELVADYLSGQLELAKNSQSSLALLYLELDQFQLTNEVLGHQKSDQLLCQVAELLRQLIPTDGYLARMGGDDFLVVLPHLKMTEDAARFAQEILRRFKQSFQLAEQAVALSASVGISLYPDDAEQCESLLTHAKTAVSRARAEGGAQFQFYTRAMNAWCHDRMFLEVELNHALRHNQLQLAYQPQFDLKSGELVGFEALARWQHAEQGWIPPDRFIPVAEESGLILTLGEWAISTACHQAVLWQRQLKRPLRMAVNISASQLLYGGLAQYVSKVLRQTGLAPGLLELEITESTLMQSLQQTQDSLKALQGLGVQLSIDDFGTGYSSLSYLSRMQLHKLKIDRSFIDPLPDDQQAKAIVEAIIAMGHGLNLRVIAEGLETPQHQHFLQQAGCDEAQGFLLSKPLLAEQMSGFFTSLLELKLPQPA